MATYLKTDTTLTRQEGDTAEIVLVVPNIINMDDFTEIKFKATKKGSTIISKSLLAGTIIKSDQTITVNIFTNDTKGHAGNCEWELEISNETPTVHTIAGGPLIIKKEIID